MNINMFGEVDIKVNSTGYIPKEGAIDKMNTDTLSIYNDPQYSWNEWYNLNLTRVNITWKVVELSEKNMRIKLNFTDSPAVSPFLRFDYLVIHIPDVDQLFDEIS